MRQISEMLKIFAAGWLLLALAGCDPTRSFTETERALCEAWARSLFLPSRRDTQLTAEGLTAARAQFEAACPGLKLIVPATLGNPENGLF